jgi:L-lactate dehydrogenase complex protein LldG
MTEREKILGRIREALSASAERHGHGVVQESHSASHESHASQWLPAVGESFEQRVELFRANAADLKASFQLLNSREEAAVHLRELAAAKGWKKVATHTGELMQSICAGLTTDILKTDGGYDVNELETCDAGITECDALIAQTGSVLVTSRSAGGRALSVLPPHHIVLARREQLIADLPAAFALVKETYGANMPSMISFITGPSRTGDIERILVLGAHGPKELTILCF